LPATAGMPEKVYLQGNPISGFPRFHPLLGVTRPVVIRQQQRAASLLTLTKSSLFESPPVHPTTLSAAALLAACDETRTRRSGPGGQHRNKVETAVVLIHRPTGIAAEASERRSQAENRGVALRRLRLRLALEHRTPPAMAGPSPLWQSRTSTGRIVVALDHDDYPTLVAEALDRLQVTHWNLPPAAAALGVSSSQLLRLFRREPAAWTMLGRQRAAAGLPPLS
jgi:hypothetical protein